MARLVAAVAAGLLAAAFAAHRSELRAGLHLSNRYSDFAHLWFATHKLLAGQEVYGAIGPGREFDPGWALAYPLPAVLAVTPLRWLSEIGADAAFAGIGIAILTFVLLARGWWALVPLFAWPTIKAVDRAQWSPLLTAAAVTPWLGGLLIAKPNIGLALACYRPTRAWLLRASIVAGVLLLLSFLLQPDWLAHWREAMRTPPAPGIGLGGVQRSLYEAPITCTGGVLALLALLRWRRPEARLIVALALVPQTLVGYELVPLIALVPSNLAEALVLGIGSTLAPLIAVHFTDWQTGWTAIFHVVGTVSVWLVYLPAVIMVLTRPNEGEVPAWMDGAAARMASKLPRRLRPSRARRPAPAPERVGVMDGTGEQPARTSVHP